MQFTIRKKPAKVTYSGVSGLLIGLLVATLLPFQLETYFILLFAIGSGLVFVLFISFIVPFFGGIDVNDDIIETVTGLGGLTTILISEIDHKRSTLSSLGLHIVPVAGEPLFVSASHYSQDDILKLAHYIDLSQSGWAQHV